MKTTEQKIKETEDNLKELKKKKAREEDKTTWVYIKELGIEVQNKIHHKNKSYDELVEEFGKEFLEKNFLTYNLIQALRNLEHQGKYKLGLIDTWEFVKQEDEISKKNGYVARFNAYSGYCSLDCYWVSDYSNSYLGVRFFRERKKK